MRKWISFTVALLMLLSMVTPALAAPDAVQHTVTLEEVYADGSQAGQAADHPVEDGKAFYKAFAIPQGYTAAAEFSGAQGSFNAASGAVHIAAVTGDVHILVTYTPDEPVGPVQHTVTVEEVYADGSQAGQASNYPVEDGKAFYTVLALPQGYTARAEFSGAQGSFNASSGAVHIGAVSGNVTITVTYTAEGGGDPQPQPGEHTVTIVEKYADNAQPDKTAHYFVRDGGALYQAFTVPADYTATEQHTEGVALTFNASGAVHIASVTQDVLIEITYTPDTPAPVMHTIKITETQGTRKVTRNFEVEDGKSFSAAFSYPDYQLGRIANVTLENYVYLSDAVNPRQRKIIINSVNHDYDIELAYGTSKVDLSSCRIITKHTVYTEAYVAYQKTLNPKTNVTAGVWVIYEYRPYNLIITCETYTHGATRKDSYGDYTGTNIFDYK